MSKRLAPQPVLMSLILALAAALRKGCRQPVLRTMQPVLRTLLLPAVIAAVIAGWLLAPARPLAAPPGGVSAAPKRFFDSLLGRQAPPPQFIPAPTPPTAAEVEAMTRVAAVPKPADTATGTTRSSPKSRPTTAGRDEKPAAAKSAWAF